MTIVNNENGTKVEIIKTNNGLYNCNYYEYFKACGWRFVTSENNLSKELVEWDFDIVLD